MSNNMGIFSHFRKIFILALCLHLLSAKKTLSSLIFSTIIAIGEGLIHLHDPTTHHFFHNALTTEARVIVFCN